jgi:hypothetical protein
MSTGEKTLAWGLVALALALVFVAYLEPALTLRLATQLWNCF